MIKGQLKHILAESGLCFDKVKLLKWVMASSKRRVVAFRFLRLRFSPDILLNAHTQTGQLEQRAKDFTTAISMVNVGGTYKTTMDRRTVLADKTTLELAKEFDSPSLMEVGVSDGSSAITLLEHSDFFSSITLTDLHPSFFVKDFPFGRMFYDSDHRFLSLKFLCFYINAPEWLSPCDDLPIIETITPVLTERFNMKRIHKFNAFNDVAPKPHALIKCANLLTDTYFSDSSLKLATTNLSKSLIEGGYLIISHNNKKYNDGEVVLVLQKQNDKLQFIKDINNSPLTQLFRQPGTS